MLARAACPTWEGTENEPLPTDTEVCLPDASPGDDGRVAEAARHATPSGIRLRPFDLRISEMMIYITCLICRRRSW